MNKHVLQKVKYSKEGSMQKTKRCLEQEGIEIKRFDEYHGYLETNHVRVKYVTDAACLSGFDYDDAFGFDLKDNIPYHLKNRGDGCYNGTLIGYIVKTEAEETLKEEQEKLKRQRQIILSTVSYRPSLFAKQIEAYLENQLINKVVGRDDENDAFAQYCKFDVENTMHLYKFHNDNWIKPQLNIDIRKYIKKVVFNDPATIIFWNDDTKTVVKAEGEAFDPEKGLAMAIAKKALGNKHDYYNTFLKYLKKYKPSEDAPIDAFAEIKVPSSDKNINKAYHALMRAMTKDKALKADYEQAVEEAVGYLGEALED